MHGVEPHGSESVEAPAKPTELTSGVAENVATFVGGRTDDVDAMAGFGAPLGAVGMALVDGVSRRRSAADLALARALTRVCLVATTLFPCNWLTSLGCDGGVVL